MARPKNADRLAEYRTELARARRWRDDGTRDDEGFSTLWKRMRDLYRGRHYASMSKEDRIVINMAFANINIIAPSVSVNYPKFTVNPRNPESAPQAIFTEEILNYQWRVNKWQPEFRLAVNDMLQIGHGWVKTGYKLIKEEKAAEPAETDEDLDIEDEESPPGESTTVRIVEDRPFVERVSPFDMYVDPDARTLREARWIAQRIYRPIADVRNDKRYKSAKARREAVPSAISRFDDNDGAKGTDPTEPEENNSGYIEVYEFYDIKKRSMSVFARDGGDEFLVPPQEQPFSFGHPFVMFRNYEVVDEFYPMGELEAIEVLQLELNETRTQMMNHRKRFSRKWLYKKEAFDKTGLSQLRSNEDNVMVPVEDTQTSLGEVIIPMPAVTTPADFYNHSDLITADINQVSGVSEYQRGAMPEIRRTATEASIAQDSANARASDKLGRIEVTLAEIGERVVQLLQQFMTEEQVARVVYSTQYPIWIKYDKDYIQGQFDFEVEAGSTQPMNESFRRQSAMQLMDAMAPLIELGVVNPMALAQHVLQYGFGLKTASNIVQEPPPPPPEEEPLPEELPPEEGQLPPEEEAMLVAQEQGLPPEAMEMVLAEAAGGGPPAGPPPMGPPSLGATLPPEVLAEAKARGIDPALLEQLVQLKAQGVERL